MLINTHYDELNDNDYHIAQYVLNHIEETQNMSIIELAEETLTSKSSVLRFTQKLGFSGFSEFKYSLKEPKIKISEKTSYVSMQETDLVQTAKLFNQQNIEELLETFHNSDRVFCYGTGWGQRHVLNNFVKNLVPLQKFPIHLESQTELKLVVDKSVTNKDMIIVLSLSGNNKPTEDLLHKLKFKEAPLLSITNLSTNRLASNATYNLYYQSTKIDQPVEETYSMLPLFQIMDLFYRSYVDFLNDQQASTEI